MRFSSVAFSAVIQAAYERDIVIYGSGPEAVDFSARVQAVSERDDPDFHLLLREFEKITGCGVLVNTSFNVRGEPIVRTPEEAWQCFRHTGMDVLALENFLLLKEKQVPASDDEERKKYELD